MSEGQTHVYLKAERRRYGKQLRGQTRMKHALEVVRDFDLTVYGFLQPFAGNWFLDRLASFEENSNLLKGGLIFAIYTAVWFWTGPQKEGARRKILAILIGVLLSLVVARTIANLAPFRTRPLYSSSAEQSYSFPISRNMENWSSFPSDTATYFFGLAFGLARLAPRSFPWTFLYTAIWICLPRMFLGEHYLSDIIAGAVLGPMVVALALRSNWLDKTVVSPVLRVLASKPHIFYGIAFLAVFEMAVLFDDVREIVRGILHAFRH